MTRPLFADPSWNRARAVLAGRQSILVALDLDGTLAPIASRPDLVRVSAATLRSLQRAVGARRTRIVILSARPARDIRLLLPVRGVLRVGQYGLEGPLAPAPSTLRRYRPRCARVARALRPFVEAAPGALLEPKGLTVAVHYRNVTGAASRRRLRRGVRSVASRVAREEDFVPMPGAKITDFVPRGHDKGSALRGLVRRYGAGRVFYFGDSAGDEPAFAALGAGDFAVRVGRGATRARYRVAGIHGVTRFLDAVTALRAGPA
ncbi:MAG TPA: trehalose-phosphatase [Candidatus Polarisedimenticolia bacterium]|nr:trehalose-phosphatase [Candidatus Polarisedimenticolia bacterium]